MLVILKAAGYPASQPHLFYGALIITFACPESDTHVSQKWEVTWGMLFDNPTAKVRLTEGRIMPPRWRIVSPQRRGKRQRNFLVQIRGRKKKKPLLLFVWTTPESCRKKTKTVAYIFQIPGAARLKINGWSCWGNYLERKKIKGLPDLSGCVSGCLGSLLQRRQLSLSIGDVTISKERTSQRRRIEFRWGHCWCICPFNDAGPGTKCSAVSRTDKGIFFCGFDCFAGLLHQEMYLKLS